MIVRMKRFALVGLCFLLASQSHAAAPVVAGFERFGKTDAAAGNLLLGELNCVACHAPAEKSPLAKQAPVLDSVGSRLRTSYFKTFLSDPQKVKPGSTMPHVFAGDPDAAVKIEALSHFLASTGSPKQEFPDAKSANAGKDVYHKIGCVACHGTRDTKGQADKTTPSSVPLGDLKAKYTLASLAAFLTSPHQARPSGRMPLLLVTGEGKERAKEARDLANYLIQGAKVNVPVGKGTTAYQYYEGTWENLPDFAKLKPAATGVGAAFSLEVARRHNDMGLKFDGFIRADSDGTYNFHLNSDDGSKLYVDGKQVVSNDGVHPPKNESGSTSLTKGIHAITVTFFNAGGGDELSVEIDGPNLGRQPLGNIIAATEADLQAIVQKNPIVKDEDYLEINKDLVAKGKALFASEGCASCHQMKGITNAAKAPALASLKGTGGCIADAPVKGSPFFALSAAQKTAIGEAIKAPAAATKDPATVIARTLLTFNCYACHGRDKIGGPEESLNEFFQTTQKEMGDEARIPPLLDNVGGKINLEYLTQILNIGSHDRPYMLTRMPAFGAANTGSLVAALAEHDKGKFAVAEDVKFEELPGKIKGIGRHLVGAKAFGCIKCHTFAGQKAEGTQGIDMTLMPQRVTHDWFVAYLSDPQKIRPGTRMPSAFEKGKSLLPGILGGRADTQIDAIWSYLKDGKKAQLPEGVKKQSIPLTPEKDAIIYRNFIEGVGPRAIAVGYPEKVNLAFDANEMRLATIWQGSFMDAGRHWTGRGEGFEPPLGDNVVHLAKGSTFAVLKSAEEAWPTGAPKSLGVKFGGYHTSPDERPTFVYSIGDVKIEDFPNATGGKDAGIKRTLTLVANESKDLYFRAAVGSKIESLGNNVYRIDGAVRMTITGVNPVVRTSAGKMELIAPVTFTDGKAKIVQEIAW